MDDQPPSQKSTWHFSSLETCVHHYATMALTKGWIDYARVRVKELENHETGLWKGLGKMVAQRMKEIQNVDRGH
jgi:hypothetical protein